MRDRFYANNTNDKYDIFISDTPTVFPSNEEQTITIPPLSLDAELWMQMHEAIYLTITVYESGKIIFEMEDYSGLATSISYQDKLKNDNNTLLMRTTFYEVDTCNLLTLCSSKDNPGSLHEAASLKLYSSTGNAYNIDLIATPDIESFCNTVMALKKQELKKANAMKKLAMTLLDSRRHHSDYISPSKPYQCSIL